MKKAWTLRLLQSMTTLSTVAVIGQTVAVTWVMRPEPFTRWVQVLPMAGGILGLMWTAAAGGPLVADKIKQAAGVLGGTGDSTK